MNKNKYYKPQVVSLLMLALIVAFLAVLNIIYILPLSKIISIILSIFLIPLFIFLFFPVLRYQRVCIQEDKIVIKCFWNSYTLSSDSFFELYKNRSYRFHDKGRYFQISPSAYEQSDEIKKKLDKIIANT